MIFAKPKQKTATECAIDNKTAVFMARDNKTGGLHGNVAIDENIAKELGGYAFYCNRPDNGEKNAGVKDGRNEHVTPKPVDLMRHIVSLVTAPGGIVLDPFCGSGGTGAGCVIEGLDFVGIELLESHAEIAKNRIQYFFDEANK